MSKSQRQNPRTPWLYVGELLAREIGRLVAMEVRYGVTKKCGFHMISPKTCGFHH